MLFCSYNPGYPVEYLSSGHLFSKDGFVHPKRNIDSFVLIIVREGILHITQNERPFDVGENEGIVLFPFQNHYGYKPSTGPLSYYWSHFYVTDPDYHIYNQGALLRHNDYLRSDQSSALFPNPIQENPDEERIILPEMTRLPAGHRSLILFSQLLDMSRRENYQRTWLLRYALNLLLAEYYREYLASGSLTDQHLPGNVKAILEWIRTHFENPLTVADLAEQFGYNPTYMTSMMKKYTGLTVNELLNYYRINAAKNLLSTAMSGAYFIRNIAYLCGFTDEKYFMRVFKKLEGMTPSQYQNAFNEKKMVTK